MLQFFFGHIALEQRTTILLQRNNHRLLRRHALLRNLSLRAKIPDRSHDVLNQVALVARRIQVHHAVVFDRHKRIRWTRERKQVAADARKVHVLDQIGHKVEATSSQAQTVEKESTAQIHAVEFDKHARELLLPEQTVQELRVALFWRNHKLKHGQPAPKSLPRVLDPVHRHLIWVGGKRPRKRSLFGHWLLVESAELCHASFDQTVEHRDAPGHGARCFCHVAKLDVFVG